MSEDDQSKTAPEASPVAAAKGANSNKKKKPKNAAPPCPPEVATAYLILRGAVAAVTGAACVVGSSDDNNNNIMTTSLLQPTYVSDPGTGKFSVNLGKKNENVYELDLPSTPEGCEAFYAALEATANRIITERLPIKLYAMSKQDIVQQFGAGCLDSSLDKTPPETVLHLAHVDRLLLAVSPTVPLAHTSDDNEGRVLQSLQLDRSQCSILGGERNPAKVQVKFKIIASSPNTDSSSSTTTVLASVQTTGTVPSEVLDTTTVLQQAQIRCPEGLALKEELQGLLLTEEKRTLEQEAQQRQAEEAKQQRDEAAAGENNNHDDDFKVTVEEVSGIIDYNRLVEKFGSTLIDEALLAKLHRETVGKGRVPALHRFLRRGMFFSHRDLHILLDAVGKGKPLYLYTGRGPSSESMHLGHLIPFLFTKWLQDALDAPLVIQMTDDEKFIFKGKYDENDGDNLMEYYRLTMENAKDIIACGFDYDKTFLFSDLDYVGTMYPNIVRIWKAVTSNAVSNIFGFEGDANVGKIAFPAVQAAPSFASSFPKVLEADRNSDYCCLIPCAIDQDPYFRMTRDIAHKLCKRQHVLSGKPALIHSKFFPPLQGAAGKMSSSDDNSAIFLTDSASDIARKIKEKAFSGGRDTKELQQQLGANLEVDVAFQWLRFFLEDDDELSAIAESYGSGQGAYWSTSLVKGKLVQVLQELVAQHQQRRAQITDDEVRRWMQERSIVPPSQRTAPQN